MARLAVGLRQRLASQLGHPRGVAGRVVAASLNRRNRGINAAAIEAAQVAPGARTLDIGFGGGVGLAALLASPTGAVTGVELSSDMVASARRRFADQIAGGRLSVVQSSVSELPFPDASFDCIVTVNTLYFWPDPQAGAREMSRVLAPGGRLVVAIVPERYLTKRKLDQHGFRTYGEAELSELLRTAKLDHVSVERTSDAILGIGSKQRVPR